MFWTIYLQNVAILALISLKFEKLGDHGVFVFLFLSKNPTILVQKTCFKRGYKIYNWYFFIYLQKRCHFPLNFQNLRHIFDKIVSLRANITESVV